MSDGAFDAARLDALEARVKAVESGRFASLRTGRLLLVDEQGKTRAMLMTTGDEAGFVLFDGEGQPTLTIRTGDEKTEFAIHSATGSRRALISLGYETNQPTIALCTPDSDPSVALRAVPNGSQVLLFDDRQKCRLFLSVDEPMGPRLTLNDDLENHRLELVAWPGRDGAMLIVDDNGEVSRAFSSD